MNLLIAGGESSRSPCPELKPTPARLMHFYSGLLMYFCSGVDMCSARATMTQARYTPASAPVENRPDRREGVYAASGPLLHAAIDAALHLRSEGQGAGQLACATLATQSSI